MQVVEKRPWGKFEVLHESRDTKIKKITVLPGQRLSYQSHKYRAEHWVVVEGELTTVLSGEEIFVDQGRSIYIPQGANHRMWNKDMKNKLVVVEVQLGSYFGEDDITRIEDDYNRE